MVRDKYTRTFFISTQLDLQVIKKYFKNINVNFLLIQICSLSLHLSTEKMI